MPAHGSWKPNVASSWTETRPNICRRQSPWWDVTATSLLSALSHASKVARWFMKPFPQPVYSVFRRPVVSYGERNRSSSSGLCRPHHDRGIQRRNVQRWWCHGHHIQKHCLKPFQTSFAQWMNAADVDLLSHILKDTNQIRFVGNAKVEYDQWKAFEGADFVYGKNWVVPADQSWRLWKDITRIWDGLSTASTWKSPTTPLYATVCLYAAIWSFPTMLSKVNVVLSFLKLPTVR